MDGISPLQQLLLPTTSPAFTSLVIIVGSGRLWSSGCRSRPLPHVRLRWEPDLGVHTEGLPMCWCRRGKNHCRQTPTNVGTDRENDYNSSSSYPKILSSNVQLGCTCILLLPQSATMMFPLTSTATPVGALNWPFPSPFEPNFNTSSPSGVKTWRGQRKTRSLRIHIHVSCWSKTKICNV